MKRKVFIISLIALCVLSISFNFAESDFADVDEEFWAEDYIKTVTEKNILEGYEDGNFYPNKKMKKVEVIIGIYNVFDEKGLVTQNYLATYKPIIESIIEVPKGELPYTVDEIKKAIAFALEKEIISESELKYFVKEGAYENVEKLETTVFIGKALNLVKKEDLDNKIISLKFKDQLAFPLASIPYIDLLIRNDIVNENGDDSGRFNPSLEMNRSVGAVFLSNFYDALDKESGEAIDDDKDTPSDEEVTSSSNSGAIQYIHKDMELIDIVTNNGEMIMYDLSEATIYVGNNKATISDLKLDHTVDFIAKGDKIQTIKVKDSYQQISGKIKYISKVIESPEEKYRVISIVKSDGEVKYFKVVDDTYISLDTDAAEVSDLAVDQKVMLQFDMQIAKTIKAYSKTKVITGVLNRPISNNNVISVELANGKTIIREAKNIDAGVNRGDIVRLTLSYGEVTKVESTGESSIVSGKIKAIVISESPKVTIRTEEGSQKTYSIIDQTEIVDANSDKELSIYDLRLEKTCQLKINSIGVVKLSLTKPLVLEKIKGRVNYVHMTSNLLEVITEENEKIIVSFYEESNLKAMDYKVDDEVVIQGSQLSNGLFEARNIVIIK